MAQPSSLLQERIGYIFKDERLLITALTHSSALAKGSYERLEFLGDRILGLVIAEMIYRKFPEESEGDLAKRLASLVQGSTLATISKNIHLKDFIILSDAEREAGGGANENIISDVFEAVIGAMYLDGGLEVCQRLIENLWSDVIHVMKRPPLHPKTKLQEWAQGKGLPLPQYDIAGQSGPDHAPTFNIRLSVKGYPVLEAQGRSRQEAEKEVARQFLKDRNIESE